MSGGGEVGVGGGGVKEREGRGGEAGGRGGGAPARKIVILMLFEVFCFSRCSAERGVGGRGGGMGAVPPPER